MENGRILLIEPHPGALAAPAEILRREGYQVLAAGFGEEDLICAWNQGPELILFDASLPADLWDTLQQLQDRRGGPPVPSIVLNQAGKSPGPPDRLRPGYVDQLLLPVGPGELLARVRLHRELFHLRTGIERQAAESLQLHGKLSQELAERLAHERELQANQVLLEAICQVQTEFLRSFDQQGTFESLLATLLELTKSEYGYIGEVRYRQNGQPYLKVHAITNIAWNQFWRDFYAEKAPAGLEFDNLQNLFGTVITTKAPVIANDPAHDPRRGGLPPGHPPLDSFLGLPFFQGDEIVGTVGVANRPGGYEAAMIDQLAPFLSTCAALITACRMKRNLTEAGEAASQAARNWQITMDAVNDAIWIMDDQQRIIQANRVTETFLGISPAGISGKKCCEIVHKSTEPHPCCPVVRARESLARETMELPLGHRWVEVTVDPIPGDEGKCRGFVHIMSDITERKEAEARREADRQYLAQIIDFLPDATFVIDIQNRVTAWNRAMEELTAIPAALILGKGDYAHALPFFGYRRPILIDLALNPDPEIIKTYVSFRQEGERIVAESHLPDFRGRGPSWFRVTAAKLYGVAGEVIGAIESIQEITELRLAEAEQKKLEAQFLQAQKMEAVGRLAGGVAHDFNNMLGVILGQAELAAMKLPSADPLHHQIKEITKAARRSADLVRQLLAFARKQIIEPQKLDINERIEEMLKMLRRLVGENIDLHWRPGPSLWPVVMDPSQLDQILTNLVVNARDAISGPGKLTIETSNADLDSAYCRTHAGALPGRYVLLAASDNGCGMDRETLAHLFEPFFTTKKVGEGTGLGLATVYGIVKQNQGFINVYSEPGQGSVFKIYLPRASSPEPWGAATHGQSRPASGTETVLLIEDEKALLEIARELLQHLGYRVITASGPKQALQLVRECREEIHLLITDVVMPEMDGRELCRQIQSLWPAIKCLYMSGYTADVIAHHGILEEGVHFLQKPFSLENLALKVREALGKD